MSGGHSQIRVMQALRDLVAADRVVDRGEPPQARGGLELRIFHLVVEVDVVIPGVGECGSVEDRCHLGDTGLEGVRSDERVETEEARRRAAPLDSARPVPGPAAPPRSSQWPAVEVEDLSHESSRRIRKADHPRLQSQLSSSG